MPVDTNSRDYWTLWRLAMLSPSGWAWIGELRAPSEPDALAQAATYWPDHTVLSIARRPRAA